jgi:hypothetical protein
MCFAQQGRLSEAALAVDRINEIDATFPPAHEMRADLHWIQEGDDAVEYERVLWAPDAEMSDVFRDIRPSRDGRSMLRDAAMLLQKRAGSAYVAPRHIVRLLSLAGRAGDALSVLERAIADDDFMTVDILQMFPAYAAVRRHRRYPALLARLGLADN